MKPSKTYDQDSVRFFLGRRFSLAETPRHLCIYEQALSRFGVSLLCFRADPDKSPMSLQPPMFAKKTVHYPLLENVGEYSFSPLYVLSHEVGHCAVAVVEGTIEKDNYWTEEELKHELLACEVQITWLLMNFGPKAAAQAGLELNFRDYERTVNEIVGRGISYLEKNGIRCDIISYETIGELAWAAGLPNADTPWLHWINWNPSNEYEPDDVWRERNRRENGKNNSDW